MYKLRELVLCVGRLSTSVASASAPHWAQVDAQSMFKCVLGCDLWNRHKYKDYGNAVSCLGLGDNILLKLLQMRRMQYQSFPGLASLSQTSKCNMALAFQAVRVAYNKVQR